MKISLLLCEAIASKSNLYNAQQKQNWKPKTLIRIRNTASLTQSLTFVTDMMTVSSPKKQFNAIKTIKFV